MKLHSEDYRSLCIRSSAWALKRGYLTAKAGRPDVYRAANALLRMALDGRLCLCLRPPNFTAQKGKYSCTYFTHEWSVNEITQVEIMITGKVLPSRHSSGPLHVIFYGQPSFMFQNVR